MKYLACWFATAFVFCGLDILWITNVAHDIFAARISALLAPEPNMVAAGIFYVAYPIGLVVLAVNPPGRRSSVLMAAALGALTGLMAYGTYEMTNMATLEHWSWTLVAIDTGWGTFVSAASAAAGSFALERIGRR